MYLNIIRLFINYVYITKEKTIESKSLLKSDLFKISL